MKKLFLFTLLSFITILAYSQQLDCTSLKKGRYKMLSNNNSVVIIKRTRKYQFEYVPAEGYKIKLKINWIDDCNYELVANGGNKKWRNHVKERGISTEVIHSEIIEITDDYFIVESTSPTLGNKVLTSKILITN